MNKLKLRKIITEMLVESLLDEAFEDNKKKGSKRYIPEFITFPKEIRDMFMNYTEVSPDTGEIKKVNHFKLMKDASGEYKLYMSPNMKVAIDSLERGRPGTDYLSKTSELAKLVNERIPQGVRGILKKYSNKLNSALNMYGVNTKIKDVENGNIKFYNPGVSSVVEYTVTDRPGFNQLYSLFLNSGEGETKYNKGASSILRMLSKNTKVNFENDPDLIAQASSEILTPKGKNNPEIRFNFSDYIKPTKTLSTDTTIDENK
jgi:hypothetical protein